MKKIYSLLAFGAYFFYTYQISEAAGISSAVKRASSNAQSTSLSIIKPISIFVVTLIAITLTVSGEKARMKAKDHVGFLILGIAGVLLAPVITSTIMYWFGK